MTMKHKTRTERVYNEATGWYETREVELKCYTFTDDDRILIIREYLESGVPAEEIIKRYHISSRSVLFSWMDKFLNGKDILNLSTRLDLVYPSQLLNEGRHTDDASFIKSD